MRKLFVTMWVTLDGYIAGPKGEMDFVGEFFDAEMGQYEDDVTNAADTLLLGRVTYDSFAGSWPNVPDNPNVSEGEKAYARKLNAMRKVVFSRTLKTADWNNSTLLREITPEAIQQLKAEPGKDIAIYGSASVVQALTNLGLIDEYQLLVHPVALGGGKGLFEGIEKTLKLKLVKSEVTGSGVVRQYYQPATKTEARDLDSREKLDLL